MWFNGVELREVSPEQWNGKTRSMVVWNNTGEQPGVGEVLTARISRRTG